MSFKLNCVHFECIELFLWVKFFNLVALIRRKENILVVLSDEF